jgi:hypothetical protein
VLSPLANEEPSGEDDPSTSVDLLSGLHAKILLAEYGSQASLWVGSANATTAAITRNVEFMVQLQGRRSAMGIDRLLSREKGETSFADLLQPYHPPEQPIGPDPITEQLEEMIRDLRVAIATSQWELVASPAIKGSQVSYTVHLIRTGSAPLAWDSAFARVSVWSVSLRQDSASRVIASPFSGELDLGVMSADALTTLVAFEIVAVIEKQELACRFVLNVPLSGGPADRRQAVLRALLRDKAKVLRFLLFLLASDLDAGDGDLDFFGTSGTSGDEPAGAHQDAPLLESLVRSLDRDPAKLDAVASLIAALQESEETRELLPEGFSDVWQAVWAARQELKV